jgi:hypothetical protein
VSEPDLMLAEPELRGFAAAPPEKVTAPRVVAQLRKTILDVYERRYGVRPDEQDGATNTASSNPFGQLMA